MVEKHTWEGLENLWNAIELVKKFKKEIKKEKIRRVYMKKEKEKPLNLDIEVFKRNELSEKYTAKILFR